MQVMTSYPLSLFATVLFLIAALFVEARHGGPFIFAVVEEGLGIRRFVFVVHLCVELGCRRCLLPLAQRWRCHLSRGRLQPVTHRRQRVAAHKSTLWSVPFMSPPPSPRGLLFSFYLFQLIN